jgi:3-oxoacyl-[acyl-carrier-protein] synthase III
MIWIRAIASYIPSGKENNLEKCAKFAMEPGFVLEKIGVEFVSRAAQDEFASDMCLSAFAELLKTTPVDPAQVECIVVCTQNPDQGGLPHVSAKVHGGIQGSDRCACFDIGLGCSGYVYALSITRSFMEANGFTQGLLFTSDPYSKIVDADDRNTSLLFGDAATVTLLSSDGLWLPEHFSFGTRGSGGQGIQKKDGVLEMNGRAVFNFSATVVPVQIRELMERHHLGTDDIDLFFLHQGSRYIVDNIRERLGVPAERVPTKLSAQGNTVSSSIPLMLQDYIHVSGYRRFLLSGFGVGLSWASCILNKAVSSGNE